MIHSNVKLKYDFYNTKDVYSDGDIEDVLLDIVCQGNDSEKTVYETDKFPLFYYLSKKREAITYVMDITSNMTVLEIGAGCGAITGALAEKAREVTCVELSDRRSKINALKNYKHNNIEIYVGNYQDFTLKKKFDVITLIGVFEYAKYYFHSNNPYEDFLCSLRDKLLPGGKIYIAIENKLGVKYFSGCFEDHTNRLFDGIEGYEKHSHVKTFSYYDWLELLKKCGFVKYKFFYPYPDYKFPKEIYSDDYLPTKDTLFNKASNYTSKRKVLFNEELFLKNLNIQNEYKIFANSFLIELEVE